MARKTKIAASVLNIRLHPHPPGVYAEWLEFIMKKRIMVQVHGDRYGIISRVDSSNANRGEIVGTITTFVKIETDGQWFNLDEMKVATEKQVSEVILPANLFPNTAAFYFLFDLKNHHLYFETYSKGKTFTANSALRFFSGLAKNLDVAKRFNEATINIVWDEATLRKMFSIDRIKEIEITIFKPNPDFFDNNFKKNLEQHMLETKTKELALKYKAEAGKSLKPDPDMKKLGEYALENGAVRVIGRDEQGRVDLNSDSYPREIHDKFDPDKQLEEQAFHNMVRKNKAAS